jgi:hypothetical protein
MRGIVAHVATAAGRMEREPAARGACDGIITVVAQGGRGVGDRPGKEPDELRGARGVEVADPAGLGAKRVHERPLRSGEVYAAGSPGRGL